MQKVFSSLTYHKIYVTIGIIVFSFIVIQLIQILNFITTKMGVYQTAPQIPPMILFKTVHNNGCLLLITDSNCYTKYLYVARGRENKIVNEVYENLIKNSNYSVYKINEENLLIDFKNRDPNSEDVSKDGFEIEFLTAPKPTDTLWGFFTPTNNCKLGMVDCVEAEIIIQN